MQAATGVFRSAKTRCWQCGWEIRVYTWPGHQLWPETCPEDGRPETVQRVYSKTLDDAYWVNTCENCGAIQGDWFLYVEPEGAFFGQDAEIA